MQQRDRVIHLLDGGEAADGEADRAVRQFVVASQGAQHIGRLQAGRSAGRTAGHRDVLDRHDQRLALDKIEAHVQIVRHAALHVAVEIHLFHVRQAGPQAIAQHADTLVLGRHFFLRDVERLAHADDLVRRQGAGTETALMSAAVHLRFQSHARFAPHVQRADPFGAVSLVRGKTHQIDLELLQVDHHLAGRLRRIDMQQHALFATQLADGGNILDHADLVVHIHHRHENGIGADRGLELVQVDQSVRFRGQIGRAKTLPFQLAHGIEYGFVLGLHGDDVFALARVKIGRALQRQIVRFGRAGSPHDLFRVGVDQRRDLFACALDRCLRLPAVSVRTRSRITEFFSQIRNHRRRHARIDRRSRGVVHVDRKFHLLCHFLFSSSRKGRANRL